MNQLALDHVEVDSKMRGSIAQPTLLLMHILAGRSILTCRSRRTGARMTMRFSRPDDERNNEYAQSHYHATKGKEKPIWVSLYGGPEGDFTTGGADRRNWKFIGTIWPSARNDRPEATFRKSPKSPLTDTHAAVLTAAWIASRLSSPDSLMENADWWHEGVCGRCGRRLTVPESIDTGFGPECVKRMGL